MNCLEVINSSHLVVSELKQDSSDDNIMKDVLPMLCSDINECEDGNGGCAEVCVNTKGSRRCDCGRGRVLDEDGYNCRGMRHTIWCCTEIIKLRICLVFVLNTLHIPLLLHPEIAGCHVNNGGCSHGCSLLLDSYRCYCPRGLELGDDKRTCQGVYVCEKKVF